MQGILKQLARHAMVRPDSVALEDASCAMTYRQLFRAIAEVGAHIGAGRVAVMMDNGVAWAVVDLTIAQCRAVSVPVPAFFSGEQLAHLLTDAAPDLLITDRPGESLPPCPILRHVLVRVAETDLHFYALQPGNRRTLPSDTGKITYTSGTTGKPKGVCVTRRALDETTEALAAAVDARPDDRSLTVLPLSTLLANIGGIYVPILRGATAVLPALAQCGFTGSSSVEPATFMHRLDTSAPTATILVPQLLKLVVECADAGAPLPATLRFVAVGGAPSSTSLLARARTLGLPVHEGYGLSEATSVVSMNRPGNERPGSVGKPLPHARVRIEDDGEIVVSGALFAGYLGQYEPAPETWHTGDTGWLDADGFLYIGGRKKTAFATAFGRNVSPEWVESELVGTRAIAQAAVFGEGREFNVAVIVPMPGTLRADIDAAIESVNTHLPDYARVRAWCAAEGAFSVANGLARAGGAPIRHAIALRYALPIESLYESEVPHVES